MAISAPITRSPGKLSLVYGNALLQHRAGVNYINGTDITDIDQVANDAEALGAALGHCLPVSETITGWELRDINGVVLYRANLEAPIVGDHGTAPSMPAYYSASVTIPGRGAPVTFAGGSGLTLFRFFTRNAYLFVPGNKRLIGTAIDTQISALANLLNTNLRFFADYYGQHADTTGDYQVQFNAYVQRHTGS